MVRWLVQLLAIGLTNNDPAIVANPSLTCWGENVSHRQLFIGAAGLILGVIGLAALWFPVYLDQFDHYGMQISCGDGLGFHLAMAHADSAAAQCGTAMLVRRVWAIPTVAIGGVMVTWFVMKWAQSEREPA